MLSDGANAENHGNILTDTSSSGNIINGIGMYGQQAHLTSLTWQWIQDQDCLLHQM